MDTFHLLASNVTQDTEFSDIVKFAFNYKNDERMAGTMGVKAFARVSF